MSEMDADHYHISRKAVGRFISHWLIFFFEIGLVWLIAWTTKPNLDSGTVWFIAVLYAWLMTILVRDAVESSKFFKEMRNDS